MERGPKKYSTTCPGDYSCRMLDAFQGKLQQRTDNEVEQMWSAGAAWEPLREGGRTLGSAAIAFSMISSFACTAYQLIFSIVCGFPFKLFELVVRPTEEFARELLATPTCLLDEWSRQFLKKFSTVAKLISRRALAILASMGYLLRWDICFLECRSGMHYLILAAGTVVGGDR